LPKFEPRQQAGSPHQAGACQSLNRLKKGILLQANKDPLTIGQRVLFSFLSSFFGTEDREVYSLAFSL